VANYYLFDVWNKKGFSDYVDTKRPIPIEFGQRQAAFMRYKNELFTIKKTHETK